ncbi:sensor histidine kinase [Marinobacter sp. F3R11]|uniref:sensor histidine kinase n=1 Tax=Marinobacter sp. F3R11 TaxID=2267231 RepID=UPI0011E5CB7B|nr:ATP-binding protein [Marinobacter sp. F3R11]
MLKSVIDESMGLLRATLPARIKVELSCDSSLPLVLVDPTQMAQVLINLITNAVQAMGANPGRIDIRVDMISAEDLLDQGQTATLNKELEWPCGALRMSVQGDGPGMDTAMLARIFEPFFTTKPVGQGTGLGLSVAHGIVQSHGGLLQACSQQGKGSTFTGYLLVLDGDAEVSYPELDKQTRAISMPTKRTLHFLYIDDAMLVPLITRLFEKRGVMVTGAAATFTTA